MPDRTNDHHTAAAMEAAGCEVLSGSDTSPIDNLLRQPPPHHPHSTSTVELTNRYPGDPKNGLQVAMVLFWLHRAHRLRIPMIFFCHQHTRQFDGYATTRFTEYILRYALTRFNGDLHFNTVFGIGKYWREVLSERTRRVTVQTMTGGVTVSNSSDFPVQDAPVDVSTAEGRRFTLLATVPAGQSVTFRFSDVACPTDRSL
jgi:hypothetical protein